MELVPGFVALLQGISATITAPTFVSWTTVLTGWVFAGRRTITRMILAAGDLADKHFSSHHLFSTARWSLDALGLALFDLIQPFLGEVVFLALDDTLARKRGLRMFGTGTEYYNLHRSHMERDHLPPVRIEPEKVQKLSVDQVQVRSFVGGLIKGFERKAA